VVEFATSHFEFTNIHVCEQKRWRRQETLFSSSAKLSPPTNLRPSTPPLTLPPLPSPLTRSPQQHTYSSPPPRLFYPSTHPLDSNELPQNPSHLLFERFSSHGFFKRIPQQNILRNVKLWEFIILLFLKRQIYQLGLKEEILLIILVFSSFYRVDCS
jgi:hypothetical protein